MIRVLFTLDIPIVVFGAFCFPEGSGNVEHVFLTLQCFPHHCFIENLAPKPFDRQILQWFQVGSVSGDGTDLQASVNQFPGQNNPRKTGGSGNEYGSTFGNIAEIFSHYSLTP